MKEAFQLFPRLQLYFYYEKNKVTSAPGHLQMHLCDWILMHFECILTLALTTFDQASAITCTHLSFSS